MWGFASSNTAALVAVAAGTQTGSTGTIVMSNSNGVSFGMSNNSVITASYNPVAISGAGNSVSAGTVVFSNSNNVSFGMAGSTVTATISVPAVSAISGFAAGTQTATSGTIVLSNSNGITFGMSNSSVVTASYDGVRSISAGTSSGSFTGITFSNSNNVSFGLSNGVITATAVAPAISFFESPSGAVSNFSIPESSGAVNLSLQRFFIPANLSATRFDYVGSLSVAGSAASTTLSIAIYTRTGSTLSSASSITLSAAWDATTTASATNNYGGQSGQKCRSNAIGTFNFTPGEYWLGLMNSGSGTGGAGNVSISAVGVSAINFGIPGGGNDVVGEWGLYTSATGAFPSSSPLASVIWTGSAAMQQPYCRFYGTFS